MPGSIHGVAVHHEDLSAEVQVWILYALHPVDRRQSPTVGGPGISDPCVDVMEHATN